MPDKIHLRAEHFASLKDYQDQQIAREQIESFEIHARYRQGCLLSQSNRSLGCCNEQLNPNIHQGFRETELQECLCVGHVSPESQTHRRRAHL